MSGDSGELRIKNESAWRQQIADATLAESMAARLAVRGEARFVEQTVGSEERTRTWLLLSGEISTAVAIDLLYPTRTLLASTLSLLRCAAVVDGAMKHGEWPEGEWDLSAALDESWRPVVVDTAIGDLHMAVKGSTIRLPPYALQENERKVSKVSLPVTVYVSSVVRGRVGESIAVGTSAWCRVDGVVGRIDTNAEEKVMTLQLVGEEVDENGGDSEVDKLGVSLELGMIELSVSSLCRLRKGMKIEIERPEDVKCVLKIGSSKLAVAAVRFAEQGEMVLEVKEVF